MIGEDAQLAGPKCKIKLYNKKYPGSVNIYEIQQNWCVAAAGDIKIKRLIGPFIDKVDSKKKGKYNNVSGHLELWVYDSYPD